MRDAGIELPPRSGDAIFHDGRATRSYPSFDIHVDPIEK